MCWCDATTISRSSSHTIFCAVALARARARARISSYLAGVAACAELLNRIRHGQTRAGRPRHVTHAGLASMLEMWRLRTRL